MFLGAALSWAAGGMVAFSVAFIAMLEGYVSGAMRRYVAAHRRQHPFDFENHVGLTREIGDLFKVRTNPADTLESNVSKVRASLGLPTPVRRTQHTLKRPRVLEDSHLMQPPSHRLDDAAQLDGACHGRGQHRVAAEAAAEYHQTRSGGGSQAGAIRGRSPRCERRLIWVKFA